MIITKIQLTYYSCNQLHITIDQYSYFVAGINKLVTLLMRIILNCNCTVFSMDGLYNTNQNDNMILHIANQINVICNRVQS